MQANDMGSLVKVEGVNQEVSDVLEELGGLYRSWKEGSGEEMDGFLLYLFGILLEARGEKREAVVVLAESVNEFPYNWSAWKAIAALCPDRDHVADLELNDHWMKQFFMAHMFVELHQQPEDTEVVLQPLVTTFPNVCIPLFVCTAFVSYVFLLCVFLLCVFLLLSFVTYPIFACLCSSPYTPSVERACHVSRSHGVLPCS